MKRLIGFVVLMLVVLAGLWFAVLNADAVPFNYHFGRVDVPLSLILALGVAAGALLGVLASLGMVLRTRRELSRVRRSMQLAEKEVQNLRALPLKDIH